MTQHSAHKIGRWQGAGLLTTTLLGTSVFILPQMTIETAGNWAMLSWILLTLAILPVAMVFAKLSSSYPHAGGPAYFVEKAFGKSAGRTIGLLFLFVVPIGAPAAIIMTYWFIETLFGLSADWALPVQLSIIGLLFLLNYRGIQFSATLQLMLTLVITLVVTAMVAGLSTTSTPEISISTSNFAITPVLGAMGIAFWSFLGIEAISHLADDFQNPKRDLVPAIMTGTLLVGFIYLGCTYLLIDTPVSNTLSMVTVFDQQFSAGGAYIIGALGVAGGLATVNVYTASLSRLIWSLSNDNVLPGYFQALNGYQVPQRALQCILIVMTATLIITHYGKHDLEDLIGWVNGVFVLIYLASMLAAVRLLSARHRPLVALSCLFCATIAVGLGTKMLYALGLFTVFAPLLWYQQRYILPRMKRSA
ncbi:MAG: L-methionine/branched-chain amino acid transporter [Aestuariibacter sp.]|uniref:L-methionine/branched-chain amino acid transporter n=1 Tax=Marisediminitalea aggregata TaxID=634436 RepID=UPI0020CD4319|nr:L-methionine/branched-chain amino acid transporter [Marisediminitalea aggregata]MCP3865098.1 L-methionine/branched-chain amino acid transporter [Aestuariibacter sp.]MCP4527957.1 L-methionine/branched-chain amino acid transporter [Aestuariibacter sp.]MCP4947633.1 L-methionine/branched-chain amino acid transporter [Aestuariibacter sp.]MCP9476538.1 L-methionine/branched-chain amino acid transporter [Marisediminitalea aggregata]